MEREQGLPLFPQPGVDADDHKWTPRKLGRYRKCQDGQKEACVAPAFGYGDAEHDEGPAFPRSYSSTLRQYATLASLMTYTWELWLLGLQGSRLTESGNYRKTGEVLSLYRKNAGPLTYTIRQKDGYEYAVAPEQLEIPLAPDGPVLYRRLAPAPTPTPAFLSN